jgi:maltooligosyltrehalose trehalohydrolase
MVAKGREQFLEQFPSIASENAAALIPNPEHEDTFMRCKLDFADREKHAEVLLLHRDLLRLRKAEPLLGKARRGTFDGAVLSTAAFVLRFFGQEQNDRLLLVNLGAHLHLNPAPEPLLAPPLGCIWETAWSSEDPRYGGGGTPAIESEDNWNLPAEFAALLTPVSTP